MNLADRCRGKWFFVERCEEFRWFLPKFRQYDFPNQGVMHRRRLCVKHVERRDHLIGQQFGKTSESLPQLDRRTPKIAEAMNHLERDADIRLVPLLLLFLCVRE